MNGVREGYEAFVDAIRRTGEHVGGGDDSAQGYAYATELIRVALDLYADTDGRSPRFVSFSTPRPYHAGDATTDRVQGGINPDGMYDFAMMRSDRSYRISGRRGNECYLSFSFSGGADGAWPERTVATLNDRQLAVTDDGSFEIFVTPERRSGNWIQMESDVCSVIARQYFTEPPSRRRPAQYKIEALDRPNLTEPPDAELVSDRLRAVAAFIGSTNDHWPLPKGLVENGFTEALGYTGEAGALGTTDNTYCMGRWQLAPGEQLVINTDPIECGYWGLQAWNRWGQSLAHIIDDDNHPHQIVNHKTATLNSDGSVRIVLSDSQRGEKNWLNTCGFSEGVLIFRFLYPTAKPVRPMTEVM